MKNTKYIIYFFALALFSSCGADYELDDYFTLTELPGYVAFNAPGNDAFLDDVSVAEDDGTATVTIECPTGTLSDVTVEYAFSGDAEFGVDFNVAGASASGGTIVILHRPTVWQTTDQEDLEIEILTDGVQDGSKTLTITLVSASNSEGSLAVGRGGTDFLKSANVVIDDID